MKINELANWKKPIAWTIVLIVAPFVLAYIAWVSFRSGFKASH